jgi:uncharacterized protein (DUF433 family)
VINERGEESMRKALLKEKEREVPSTNHPYIVRVEGICGGRPIIVGTRTPVRSIVGYHKMGMSVEDILEGLPHLKPFHVYDALSYYYDHQEEIEQDIRADSEEQLMKMVPPGQYST